jgi:Tfp pilus assembly protein PilO
VNDSLTLWIVGAVATGILGVVGFLVRSSFEGVQRALGDLGAKLDGVKAELNRSDVRAASLESEVRAELRALRERLERLEREISEGIVR